MRFFFAWVDPSDTTFLQSFAREDLQVFDMELSQSEGEFAALHVTVRNPRQGLLAAGRSQWVWLSRDDGAAASPLFFGRMIGTPQRLEGDLVQLSFIARPQGYDAAKEALADTLRVLPYFDPVWIGAEARADPDSALSGRSAVWHIDRISHAVTASDIVTAEDGTIDYSGAFFFDSLSVDHRGLVTKSVAVSAEINWTQIGRGEMSVRGVIADAAASAGTTKGGRLTSYTGGGVVEDWPSAGQAIGAGWTVKDGDPSRQDGYYISRNYRHVVTRSGLVAKFPLWVIRPDLTLELNAERSRTETVSFTLAADVQAIAVEPGDTETEEFALRTSAVQEEIDGAYPIGDLGRRSYIMTERGRQSVEALALMARARLLWAARCVEVSFQVPIDAAWDLTCRKAASIADDRLPGGTVTGKIKNYLLSVDGQSGEAVATVTIACVPGNGGTLSPAPAGSGYVVDDYDGEGYSVRTSGQVALPTGDVALDLFGALEVDDDGQNFTTLDPSDFVASCIVTNGETVQLNTLNQYFDTVLAARDALNAKHTTVTMEMKPCHGLSFATEFPLTFSAVKLPKQIDLEAA